MDSEFRGKRVLVTGAGRGIGKALVAQLHEYGATIFALSKNLDNLVNLKGEFPNIQIIAADLEDWNGSREVLKDIGPLHCLINNAGVLDYQEFLDIQPETYDKIFNTNVKAVINVSQVVVKEMILAGTGGSILNISSSASKKAGVGFGTYAASKAALDMLTKSMAVELGKHGIRVNSINPAGIATDLLVPVMQKIFQLSDRDPVAFQAAHIARVPLGKSLVSMSDVVNLALFVLSDKAFMLHGENIIMDGGFSCS